MDHSCGAGVRDAPGPAVPARHLPLRSDPGDLAPACSPRAYSHGPLPLATGVRRAATVVVSMTPEPNQPSHDTLDATSAAELRVELALLRRTMELILLVALVLVTIGLFTVL